MYKNHGLASIPLTNGGQGVVLWVVIAAVLLGGGYMLVKKLKVESFKEGAKGEQTIKSTARETSQSPVLSDWKTYVSPAWNFRIQYPPDYYIYDYKVLPKDTFIKAAVIEVRDSKSTYQKYQKEDGPHVTDGPNVTVYINRNLYFKDNKTFLDHIYTFYPALREFTYSQGNQVELGLTKGIQFFGQAKDASGLKVNFLSRVGYHDGLMYEIIAYPPEYNHFAPIVTTFRIVK